MGEISSVGDRQESSFRHRSFVVISWIATVALLLMAGHHFQAARRLSAGLDAAFAAALLGNLFLFKRHHRLRPAIQVGLGLGAANIIGLSALESELHNGGHLWFFVLPLASIYLLGKKEGSFWTVFYFLVLFLVSTGNQPQLDTYRISFFLAYSVVAGFAYTYELLREEAETGFTAANAKLAGISRTLSRYLSPQIRAGILSGLSTARVETQRKQLTFFFADIVNFTSTTEHIEPEAMTALLNNYFEEMAKIIMKHGGTVDKYIGDAIVAFFGDPESKGMREDALAAVRMAIEMRQRMGELREHWLHHGLTEPFHIRMGLASGFATVGNFGTEEHLHYTAIGTQVNLAARLETLAQADQILISEATYRLVEGEIFCRHAGEFTVKGISYPVNAYQVVDSLEKVEESNMPIRHREEGFLLELDPALLSDDARKQASRILRESLARLH
ncbi:MAG: adenylate/guanylate cyclase domain-containing protein [Desulfurivibrionaceae bacterium]